MAKLIFEEIDQTHELDDGSLIKETCEEAGLLFACTDGICGICVVEVEEGMENLSPFTPEEEDLLGELDHERLACQCEIMRGEVKIKF